MRIRIHRVTLNCILKELNALADARHCLMEEEVSFERSVISKRVHLSSPRENPVFFWRQFDSNLLGNCARHFALQSQDVGQIAFITV